MATEDYHEKKKSINENNKAITKDECTRSQRTMIYTNVGDGRKKSQSSVKIVSEELIDLQDEVEHHRTGTKSGRK